MWRVRVLDSLAHSVCLQLARFYRSLTRILVTLRLARRFLDRRNVMLPITHDRWGKIGSVLSKAYKIEMYHITLSISVSTGLGGFVSGMIGGNFYENLC